MNAAQRRRVWWMMGGFVLILFLLCNHNDIAETAQHAWTLIRSTVDGRFFDFYSNVADRVYDFGFSFSYVNNAHYNILIYILLALWELPLYLVGTLFRIPAGNMELLIYFWVKVLCVAVFWLCAARTARIARQMGVDEQHAQTIRLFVLFCPVSLFAVFQFGSYDMFCLLFILLALEALLDGKIYRFALLIGVAAVFKFFALILFIPILLLCEKRIVRLIKLGLCGVSLMLPSTLLFWGRAAHSAMFNAEMIKRFSFLNLPTEYGEISVFFLLYALLCVFCFAYRMRTEKPDPVLCLYVGFASLALLFLTITWHPQWMVLLVPFVVLLGAQVENRRTLFWVAVLFCAGYFLNMTFMFPDALDASLLRLGILRGTVGSTGSLVALLQAIPLVHRLAPAAYAAGLAALALLLLPYKGAPLCDRQRGDSLSQRYTAARCFWGLIGIGYCAVYLAPAIVSMLLSFAKI